jgi:hypothetical protein
MHTFKQMNSLFYLPVLLAYYFQQRSHSAETRIISVVDAAAATFFHATTQRQLRSSSRRNVVLRDLSKDTGSSKLKTAVIPAESLEASSTSPVAASIYNGPVFASYDNNEDEDDGNKGEAAQGLEMEGILELTELGIDIAIGPSMAAPGQLGLYCRCSDTVDSVTLPECSLLCGYAKPGTFLSSDVVDKTVGFTLHNSTTAIFFERQLMTVQDALLKAATEYGNGSCGLAGHELSMTGDDQPIVIQPIANGFHRYYCPDNDKTLPIAVQNYGQFCNDLAWNQLSPPCSNEEYKERSKRLNCIQLVWRLEYDTNTQCLVPTWPVSVLSRDLQFENHEFMELGTHYGWNYWQATIQLDELA